MKTIRRHSTVMTDSKRALEKIAPANPMGFITMKKIGSKWRTSFIPVIDSRALRFLKIAYDLERHNNLCVSKINIIRVHRPFFPQPILSNKP
ncbi:hypothetical protein [Photobacterium leiognathi]|uniref:hypothetical protein n=1 Tax=Photobacterium leiognathi TaxID=553611 RepID=UPI00298169AF|nr:hypothetical protein [Photobacterium leiognathi]